VDLALRPNAPLVPLNDSLDEGESYTGPFEVVSRMESLEDAEELVHVFHLEADAVVANEVDVLAALDTNTDLESSDFPGTGVLDRVCDEVREHLPEQGPVPAHRRQGIDRSFDPAFRTLRQDLLERDFGQRLHVDVRQAHGGPAHPGEFEEVIDELP